MAAPNLSEQFTVHVCQSARVESQALGQRSSEGSAPRGARAKCSASCFLRKGKAEVVSLTDQSLRGGGRIDRGRHFRKGPCDGRSLSDYSQLYLRSEEESADLCPD